MKILEIPFAVLRFQYQIARIPFQLIETQLAGRLTSEAPARLFYERSLGSLDATVGSLLSDPELAKRGTAVVERSDALGRAAKLDAKATAKREQADAELKTTREEVVTDIKEARDATEQQAVDTRHDAEKRKQAAETTADQRAASAKKRADESAAQRTKSVEAAKRQEQARIATEEKKAVEFAGSKFDDAAARRDEAARKRAEADRVEGLSEAEKQKRQSERAAKD